MIVIQPQVLLVVQLLLGLIINSTFLNHAEIRDERMDASIINLANLAVKLSFLDRLGVANENR
jgi:hypothetical protein